METNQAKVIVALGEAIPNVKEYKDGEGKCHPIQWVRLKGGELNKVISAMKSDNSTATRKQREQAAQSLTTVAAKHDVDGYYISATTNLLPFIAAAFHKDDLTLLVANAGNVLSPVLT